MRVWGKESDCPVASSSIIRTSDHTFSLSKTHSSSWKLHLGSLQFRHSLLKLMTQSDCVFNSLLRYLTQNFLHGSSFRFLHFLVQALCSHLPQHVWKSWTQFCRCQTQSNRLINSLSCQAVRKLKKPLPSSSVLSVHPSQPETYDQSHSLFLFLYTVNPTLYIVYRLKSPLFLII